MVFVCRPALKTLLLYHSVQMTLLCKCLCLAPCSQSMSSGNQVLMCPNGCHWKLGLLIKAEIPYMVIPYMVIPYMVEMQSVCHWLPVWNIPVSL